MRKLRKPFILILICCFILTAVNFNIPATFAYSTSVFFDDFTSSSIDTSKWLVAYKQWGGADANGGVIPQNVSVSNGDCVLEAHGNNYTGSVKGINKDFSQRADGKRVGAAIATRDYFASGKYEVRMKVAPQMGVCSAIWTFHYQEYYPGDPEYKDKPVGSPDYYAINHEIDIEMPGRPAAPFTGMTFNRALCNTWIGENNDEYTPNYVDLGAPQNDGQYHTYRFDWHTGDTGQAKRVEFYVDGVLKNTCTTNIPTNASRLWIAAWFPRDWAGTPNFDTDYLKIDYVRVTPFDEAGDRWFAESFPNDGWDDTFSNPQSGQFFEDFTGTTLDPGKWKIAKKNWGGQMGQSQSFNGGVVPQNVKLSNGTCILEAHGEKYNGSVMGINRDGSQRTDGKRVGAAIATNRYYGSGKYEVRMKVAPQFGVCSALWTFHYQEFYPGDPRYIDKPVGSPDYYAINHEIDIEMPGRPDATKANFSFNRALCNTWIGENDDEYTPNYVDLGAAQNDGQYHTYRFDWHTNPKKVDFYVDDVLKNTCTTNIPTNASRLWIAAWFPREWAGTAKFDTSQLVIDWVRITPFNESGDTYARESFPIEGWAQICEYPVTTVAATSTPTPGGPTATPTPTPTATPTPTPTPTSTPSTNRVANPGFETGNTSSWTPSGICAVETANVKTGTYNLKLTPDDVTISRCEQTITGLSPNTTYTVTAWIKTTSSSLFCYVGVQDFGGATTEQGSNSTTYVQKSITFTTGATNTSAKIYLQCWKQQTGSGYFDDVALN